MGGSRVRAVAGAVVIAGAVLSQETSRPAPSMTLGAEAPALDERTVVLFDGKSWRAWLDRQGAASAWAVQADGSVEVKGGDSVTAEEFGDFQLHIEFRCPPRAEGAAHPAGNSGVYLHGRYEIQVLDTFARAAGMNSCGALYGLAPPLVNAARPAGEWQAYDMVFRGPRFDAAGAVSQRPRLTVLHNGIVVHNNLEVASVTPGGLGDSMVASGPLLLQDHGDAVRYRNIWLRRLS